MLVYLFPVDNTVKHDYIITETIWKRILCKNDYYCSAELFLVGRQLFLLTTRWRPNNSLVTLNNVEDYRSYAKKTTLFPISSYEGKIGKRVVLKVYDP